MSKDREKLEEFENVINGLEKANIKFYQFSLLVIYPKGFWKYYNYIVLCLLEIVSVYFLITGVITFYLKMNDIFLVFEVANAYLIFLAVFMNLTDFHVIRKKRLLWYKLLRYCKDGFFEYDCESVKQETERLRSVCGTNMKWFFLISTPTLIANCSLYIVIAPLIRYYNHYYDQEQKDDTAFNVFLPLPFWSIFNTRTIMGFILQYFLLVFMVFNVFVVFLVYISTVFYFFMELMIQLRILCFALTKHGERLNICKDKARRRESNQSSPLRPEESDDIFVTETLKESIIHHLKIREFFKDLQEFCSFFFCLVVGINMLVIVIASVIVTKMDSLLTVDGFKFCLMLFLETLHIFSYTYCGSLLVEESYNVKKSLYNINWYDFNSNQKKIINILQVQSASEFLLTASGIYSIDLNTFLQVLQTAYSVFNVFSSIET